MLDFDPEWFETMLRSENGNDLTRNLNDIFIVNYPVIDEQMKRSMDALKNRTFHSQRKTKNNNVNKFKDIFSANELSTDIEYQTGEVLAIGNIPQNMLHCTSNWGLVMGNIWPV